MTKKITKAGLYIQILPRKKSPSKQTVNLLLTYSYALAKVFFLAFDTIFGYHNFIIKINKI